MSNVRLKIGIVGVGMVGTPLKRYFEEVRDYHRGKDLFLYDIDPQKKYFDDINRADLIFVSVPTPSNAKGEANISAVEAVLKMFRGRKAVVIKSTVPPGTVEHLQKKYPRHKLFFSPEFLTERRAWEDMLSPDRQIVGYTASSKMHTSQILGLLPTAFFSSPGALGTYSFTDINATEAEMGKYAGNLFGALKVTFANVIKDFCDVVQKALSRQGVQISVSYPNVRAMVAHDRRIGDAWLDAEHGGYRGYGGYCLVKDTKALIQSGEGLLKKIPSKSMEHQRLTAGISLLQAMRKYNKTLLATQGLTEEDVSIHDHEWLKKKLEARNSKSASFKF